MKSSSPSAESRISTIAEVGRGASGTGHRPSDCQWSSSHRSSDETGRVRPLSGIARDLDDDLDLDGRAQRQSVDTDGAAGVLPAVSEDLTVQLGHAVDDGRLLGEVISGVDEAGDLDDAHDIVEVTDHSGDGGQSVEPGGACQLVAGVEVDIRAQVTGGGQLAVDDRQLAGGIDVVPGAQRGT